MIWKLKVQTTKLFAQNADGKDKEIINERLLPILRGGIHGASGAGGEVVEMSRLELTMREVLLASE